MNKAKTARYRYLWWETKDAWVVHFNRWKQSRGHHGLVFCWKLTRGSQIRRSVSTSAVQSVRPTTHAKTTASEGSRRFIAASLTENTTQNSIATPRHDYSNLPAANHQKDTLAGRSISSLMNSLSSTRPSDSG